ncbi:2Fe-2S iron-sulfur cluster binding domain-containing protein [Actinomycetospora sp. TBRC 11914]|nr:2Fe-2S iron-sulfur cluster binding domain-containing protein [Actinomycetospora sp. TBRC 11914]
MPDPGIPLPAVAWPTVALWAGSFAAWVGATLLALAALDGSVSRWWLLATVPVHALVTFTMFTVLHEATHHAAGRLRWVNEVLGRVSMPFVVAWATFPLVRFIHIEHHRHTNEDVLLDPDAWVEGGPTWQRPLRWLAIDLWYFRFYAPRMRQRPRGEVAGELLTLAVVVGLAAALVVTGHGLALVMVYLLPQRLGVGVLAWWFDWLPHHDLGVTARTDRFRATRVRVGREWLMTPVMLYQNYHLVHHIHPTIPFYRYVRAWENTRDDYLSRDIPIATAWGTELTPAEYRAWRGITDGMELPAGEVRPGFHRLRVADVRRLTPEAVAVTFDVPDELAATFAHRPGQHVTVRAWLDRPDGSGRAEVRRSYSVCSTAGSGVLRIGVRTVDGGRFSGWAARSLAAGDSLEVAAPAGRFTPSPDAGSSSGRRLVAVAAGSGITPVLSIVASVLEAEPSTRVTLLLGNRDAASTMFADELSMMVSRFEGRLRLVHLHSRSAGPGGGPEDAARWETVEAGRLSVERVLAHVPRPDDVEGWFLCGPSPLTDALVAGLTAQGVPEDRVHREVFTSAAPDAPVEGTTAAAVTVTLEGGSAEIDCGPDEAVLDAALRAGLDAPYSCAGGACGTCAATLRSGTVHMVVCHALTEAEVADGRILTCQARPTSGSLAVDYDDD